ncbi:hypothetical protein TNCV_4521591 [Trichonephila clavipes]|nr:hypothetical protein TNCV_4521591 [Trichonephila clavipes]
MTNALDDLKENGDAGTNSEVSWDNGSAEPFSKRDADGGRLGKTPKVTYAMLARVHEDQALSMKCVYEWLTSFQEGRESASDKIRCK